MGSRHTFSGTKKRGAQCSAPQGLGARDRTWGGEVGTHGAGGMDDRGGVSSDDGMGYGSVCVMPQNESF